MSRLVLMLALLFSSSDLTAQQDVRQIDFKNFTYPLSGNLLGHGSLKWLGLPVHPPSSGRTIHLVNGSQLKREYGRYEGFTLQSVNYGDAIGAGKEEAIVVLMYQSGGAQTTNYVYVYDVGQYGPKLLAYCHTGSRASLGLYTVSARHGSLVFELLDPARAIGDCCSSGVLISSYKWQNGAFQPVGPIRRQALPPLKEHSYK